MRPTLAIMCCFFLASACMTTATGQDLKRFGIDTTAKLPSGLPENMYAPLFDAPDADGNVVGLRDRLQQSTVILVFVQGNWSRHCRSFLKNLQDSLTFIGLEAAQIIAVSPEKPEFLHRLKSKTGATFPIVSDQDGSIRINYDANYRMTKARKRRHNVFGRAKFERVFATDPDYLPTPAVYIIAPSARIAYRYFNLDRRQRPSVSVLIGASKNLANERK